MSDLGWLTTVEAAALLKRSPHTVGHLARTGHLPWIKRGRRLLVDEAAVRERSERAAEWVSYIRAAEIVGCSETAILRAVQRGEIESRTPQNRAQPALSRASVEKFAGEWTARQAERERRRARRVTRRSVPPDDEHVWLKPATAALVLGVSDSALRQMARDERVPVTVSGGRRWYRRDHIEQAAAARAHKEGLLRLAIAMMWAQDREQDGNRRLA